MSEYKIAPDDNDIRLDRWFKRHQPDISHIMLQKLLRKGAVKLEGKKSECSTHIFTGQIISIREQALPKVSYADFTAAQNAEFTNQKYELTEGKTKETLGMVIYKDDEKIVLNKPSGLATQGGSGIKDCVDMRLEALRFGAEKPRLVHRLDRDTSGVLLLARTAGNAAHLARAFSSREVSKIYWALVVGVPQPRNGTIDLELEKGVEGMSKEKMLVVAKGEGQRAITHYRVVETLGKRMAWVELEPITGRTHQLRAHMAAIGHPIIGDGKYGGADAFLDGGIELPKQLHLHARKLTLPQNNKPDLEITAPLPPHMQQSWSLLGLS